MSRVVKCGLIQAKADVSTDLPVAEIKKIMTEKHVKLIEEAASKGVKILCLQELFNGPYFCAEQNPKWYDMTEPVPDGPTTELMMNLAEKHEMVLIVPLYEKEMAGVYYNTAAVIDADGEYLGKYRKTHIPHVLPGFFEKYYFRPGNFGYPVFETEYADVGVYICYDRHFPEGARALALNGCGTIGIPLEAGTARPRSGKRVFRGRHQQGRIRSPMEHRRVLRHKLFLRSPGADSGRRIT